MRLYLYFSMATLHILAFGIVKDIFSASSAVINIAESCISCAALKKELEEKYPQLTRLKSYMIAVNNEYAGDAVIINANDEIAIIPPVSGG